MSRREPAPDHERDCRILYLRDGLGWTWNRITVALGASVESAIRHRYGKLCELYGIPQTAPGYAFTPEEIARVVYLRDTEGRSFEYIRLALGRPNAQSCSDRYKAAMRCRPLKRQPIERACLCCRRPFMSAGAGNRLCTPCNNKADDLSPYAPDHSAPAVLRGEGVAFSVGAAR